MSRASEEDASIIYAKYRKQNGLNNRIRVSEIKYYYLAVILNKSFGQKEILFRLSKERKWGLHLICAVFLLLPSHLNSAINFDRVKNVS